MTVRRAWLVVIGLVLATACYYLPWYTHDTAGFTTNAFDLAEWTSLHPAVRSSSPPMLTSFLLRFSQLMLVAALALIANRLDDPRCRWVWRGIALLLALRFFPPSDFFSDATGDPNYRQMLLLTVLGVGGVFVAIWLARAPDRWQDALLIITLVCGVLAGWWGLSRADTLFDNFEIDVSTGPGIAGLSLAVAAVVLIVLWPYRIRLLRARAGHPVQQAT
jgi:peptidoglycan/LPS O-acetylase OafA/YrhL